MNEFVKKYCPEFIMTSDVKKNLADLFDLPYEDVIEDDTGEEVAVVYTDSGKPIPVMDIVTTIREDFQKMHPDFEERELYDKYMESIVILEGEDLVSRIRKSIAASKKEVDSFSLASEL